MVDIATGAIAGGGAVDDASQMTYDIGTGESRRNRIQATTGPWTSTDPLEKNEGWIRIGVLIIAGALALISVAATLSLFL
jgi:hypothetical protein